MAGRNVFSKYGSMALRHMYEVIQGTLDAPSFKDVLPDFLHELAEDEDSVLGNQILESNLQDFLSTARANLIRVGVLSESPLLTHHCLLTSSPRRGPTSSASGCSVSRHSSRTIACCSNLNP
jgi:hypothetical protein